ncbi:hypothetical protein B5M09_012901 [Aphanomyces astaci]|uniref:Uncharacterized protein n=1 Tax=Aphanomyces astaci TaxID=112090 RepID=A0A3R7WXS1_APHAT|nr:hypothetical protein B5M09_012901 [Aphanomyces astaci]
MQQTEVVTESASLQMPPTFTVRDTTSLPFVPTADPMSRPNHDADSYPSSGAYGQPLGVGYTQPSPRETGSGDAEVAACLRGASVRPETIEISLDYLIERDVDIDRRTDGSRSAPQMTPVAPSTPTRSARNTSRTQSSSTPNGNLQELQSSISRLQREMTSLTTSNNDQFSSIQDVVAMISTDNPAGNNPVGVRDKPERGPEDDQDPEDEEEMHSVTYVVRWAI